MQFSAHAQTVMPDYWHSWAISFGAMPATLPVQARPPVGLRRRQKFLIALVRHRRMNIGAQHGIFL